MKRSMDRAGESRHSEGKIVEAVAAEKCAMHMDHPQGARPETLSRAVLHHLLRASREHGAALEVGAPHGGQHWAPAASKASIAAGEKAPEKNSPQASRRF
eukprot:4411281-Pyramimonas_sp.AAC.1